MELPPFSLVPVTTIMLGMERPSMQISVATLLGLVACVAFNFWLFRLGALWGILGLNVTKHILIAALCQSLGVDKRDPQTSRAPNSAASPAQVPSS